MHFATAVCDAVINCDMMRPSSTNGANMKLTNYQRSQLKAAACFGSGQIDKVAASLQRENPEAFLRESELADRDFYHQPMAAHRSYVERFLPRRKSEYSQEQRQIMEQNHYLTTTYQIGVGA
jgi:hypothetical protein